MTKCRSCGAEIKWIKTKDGKNAPVNAKPIKVFLPTIQPPEQEGYYVITDAFISHFATCPDADKWRKGETKKNGN